MRKSLGLVVILGLIFLGLTCAAADQPSHEDGEFNVFLSLMMLAFLLACGLALVAGMIAALVLLVLLGLLAGLIAAGMVSASVVIAVLRLNPFGIGWVGAGWE